MIRFKQLVADGLSAHLDIIIPAGMSAVLFTVSEGEAEVVTRLIAGFQYPLAGQMVVADLQPYNLTNLQLSAYRRSIGIIYRDGGLLSNLNVWDNLILQLSYDGKYSIDELGNIGRHALLHAGYQGSLTSLPASLTLFQRRQVAFARLILAAPDLVIYQSFLDGLSRSEKEQLSKLADEYHQQGAERTALFLTSNPDTLSGVQSDFIYTTGGAVNL